MVDRHKEELAEAISEFDPSELNFKKITPPHYFAHILDWLISALHKKYGERVIVLVDEYDAPLNNSFQNGYYDKASKLFGTFYSSSLKGNSALKKGCMMGIVEVRGAGILSG